MPRRYRKWWRADPGLDEIPIAATPYAFDPAMVAVPAVAVAPTDTVMIGLGGRFRVRPTVSIVTEFSPRLAGFRPGINHGGVAIEKRAGGHTFQLNVSDSFATTMGQIARGGPAGTNWHLGFNISRKFF